MKFVLLKRCRSGVFASNFYSSLLRSVCLIRFTRSEFRATTLILNLLIAVGVLYEISSSSLCLFYNSIRGANSAVPHLNTILSSSFLISCMLEPVISYSSSSSSISD